MNFKKKDMYFVSTILFLMFFSIACQQSPAPEFNESVSVLCVLQANSKKQIAFVHRTTKYSTDIFQSGGKAHLIEILEPLFYYTASVSILKNDHQYDFRIERVNVMEGNYHQFVLQTDSTLIHPGESYKLWVKTEDMEIQGNVIIPGEFRIISPVEDQHVQHGQDVSLTISWEVSAHAELYRIFLYSPTIWSPDSTLIQRGRETLLAETSDTTVGDLMVKLDYPGEYRIKVLAFDRNFFKHYIENVDRVGLNNGYGVLGSVVADSVRFIVD
ncbi:MAG: DUF4249 family protein [Calditrichaeota bacterium]|nr:MAG: DUF4249 family protein [Calditrichota bacterium]